MKNDFKIILLLDGESATKEDIICALNLKFENKIKEKSSQEETL